jgi:hypothetical protein
MLDKLRVCIICQYYSLNGRLNVDDYMNHPAVCQLRTENLEKVINLNKSREISSNINSFDTTFSHQIDQNNNESQQSSVCDGKNVKIEISTNEDDTNNNNNAEMSFLNNEERYFRQFEITVCVGNVSKYLKDSSSFPTTSNQEDHSQYNKDLITHKWMIYVRSPNCPKLDNYIKKVIFYLHSSYKPYDVVEVKYL